MGRKKHIKKINDVTLMQCCACRQWKPFASFHKNKAKTCGLHRNCKECNCLQSRIYALEHKEQRKLWKNEYKKTTSYVFTQYKQNAKQDNRLFKLTKSELAKLIRLPCFYCGEQSKSFNGIDRINNELGYTLDNCVTCCEWCNRMKLKHSQRAFIEKCKQITDYNNREGKYAEKEKPKEKSK